MAQEVLIDLHRRIENLPARDAARREIIKQASDLYGVSESTLYRQLSQVKKPKSVQRSDANRPRNIPEDKMMQYCEIIAALKIRTTNKNGRHISTVTALDVLESTGVDSEYGFIKLPKGLLNKATVNRYLALYGLDKSNLIKHAPAVRFQAKHSNECWQFDLSPSDLKSVDEPIWYDKSKGLPILMLYSIVDDRSGVCYQQYRNVHGEDAGNALRFLFDAMAPKDDPDMPFHGIPNVIYMDNGPIAKSTVFQNVMRFLGIEIKIHMPDSKDKRRKTARSKGKVERAFRTVKECHEVLYHLREPKNEIEANGMLSDYLIKYNDHQHRAEPHSRMDDWLKNIDGTVKKMCSWERYCAFAREPEKRTVGIDARITVDGSVYEIDPDLAGEKVVLWWGLFDDELYVEHDGQRYGAYFPISGPVPLFRYRKFKKTKNEQRLDKLESLAKSLKLPETGDTNSEVISAMKQIVEPVPTREFDDPDPFNEKQYENILKAKLAISKYLGKPLAILEQGDRDMIDAILSESLDKEAVMKQIKEYFNNRSGEHAN
ncbi:DDE-type integrase/transposase/recombinase [Alteromonas macleodii]|uniref:DDE-type integrase/transposase/recombinase n=1 Tax=Alteromonas macleodii TaxID=28108 RepID=UPI001930A030|nr:DDE-type integrase/transposase/recombinase [Alteromonas macleodii]